MALSRLSLSLTLAKEAQVLAKRFASIHLPLSAATSLPADAPVVMVEVANAHVTIVTELRAKLEKDNDLIYHDSLPSVTSLPAIEKSSVITALPIHEIYATPATQKLVGPDLFEKLIPMGVVELGSVYTEEMAKLARVEAERTEGADAECEGGLGWIGLPQGLERFKQGGDGLDSLTDPGREVRQWVEEIQAHERSREGPVEHLFTQLAARKSSTANRLATTSSALEQEVQACEALRNQYGAMWEQQPSSGSTRGLRADLAAHKVSLAQASSSDEQAARIWDGIKDDVRALASTESVGRLFTETIHAALTATNGGPQATLLDLDVGAEESSEREKQEMRGLVARIQEGVTQLGKIRRERAEVLKDLKERVRRSPPVLNLTSRRSKATTSRICCSSTASRPRRRLPASTQSLSPSWRSSGRTSSASRARSRCRPRCLPLWEPTTRSSRTFPRRARSSRAGLPATRGGGSWSSGWARVGRATTTCATASPRASRSTASSSGSCSGWNKTRTSL